MPRAAVTAAAAGSRRAAAVLAGLALLAAGCGAGQSRPAPPMQRAHSSPPATASAGTPAAGREAADRGLADAYLKIAVAGNRRLEKDFGELADAEKDNLAAAETALRDAAATERLFDARVARLRFPRASELIVGFLIWVNQARAQLSVTAAASGSLRQLGGYQHRLAEANAPVEQAVGIIRSRLGLPPPGTS